MSKLFVGGSWARLSALVAVLAVTAVFAPSAGAVLIHAGHGQIAGVAPVRGVSAASVPGSFARQVTAPTPFSTNGNLDYHSGAVLHASAPYLIFWDPTNQISATDKSLYERYFADAAADNGRATNVFSVDRQFTDSTGFADYSQVFSAAQALTDTQPYPTTGNCTEASYPETTCLFDAQLQGEVSRLIAANGLPTGITGNAPIYFVVTPPSVNSCFSDNATCADNSFCAYHSSFTDAGSTVLYSDIATVLDANDPKGCQYDGNSAVQEPNGSPIADVALKAVSHEFNETITDPVNGGGWYDNATGNEDGDNCSDLSTNSNSFLPTLGGDPIAGTLYNQVMNGNPYYVQSEWSNGDVNCEMRPTNSALTAAFASSGTTGTAVSLDPSTSTSAGGYTSTTWSFGDGSSSFSTGAPATLTHTYAAAGTYTVTLTLVDAFGNVSTATHTVGAAPTAAFSVTTANPQSGSPVSFDGSASSEPGGSMSSYSWDFGDGSSAGNGVTPSHTYAAAGTYTVALTVTDASAQSASVSHPITVTASGGTSGAGTSGGGTGGTSGGGTSGGGTSSGGSVKAPIASRLRISAAAFRAAASGPSAATPNRNQKTPVSGANVSYTLNLTATMRFIVQQRLRGRKHGHGKTARCVVPTPRNRKAHSCTRTVTLRGSFTQSGKSGTNSLHFSGRVNGHKLKPGTYTLVATPTASGTSGRPVTITFQIIH